MSLAGARTETAARLKELREHLELIRALESADPTQPDSNQVLMLRGLFYVHLYSIIEFTVNQTVQSTLNFIRDAKLQFPEFVDDFLVVALDADFTSLASTSSGKKNWSRRFELLKRIRSNDVCAPNDGVLYYDLQNIWYETLELVFRCFVISEPVVPESRYKPFIDEVVEKRNRVAHGRETAARVGRGTRYPELEIRLKAIADTCNYFLDRFDVYSANLEFAKSSAHALIKARMAASA